MAGLVSIVPQALPTLLKLDRRYRSGWRISGVPDLLGETVYAHTKRLVGAVASYAPQRPRAPIMALVHDFPEETVTDYTPLDTISAEEKYLEEERAMVALTRAFDTRGEFFLDLWREFEACQTREALIVYQLDKLAAAVQALEYERDGYDVARFFTSIDAHLTDVRLREVWATMKTLRRRPGVDYHDVYYALLRVEPAR